jgi:hypothetical protein
MAKKAGRAVTKLDAGIAKFAGLAESLHESPVISLLDVLGGGRYLSKPGRGHLAFSPSQMNTYDEVLDLLCPDDGSPHERSRSATSAWVDDFLLDIASSKTEFQESLRRASKKLLSRMQAKPKQWHIYRAVGRMKVPDKGFSFGRILFFSSNDPEADRVRSACEANKIGWNKAPEEQVCTRPGELDQRFTVCRIHCYAVDVEAAESRADLEFDTTLSVLDCFSHYFVLASRAPKLRGQLSTATQNGFRVVEYPDGRIQASRITQEGFDAFDPEEFDVDPGVRKAFHRASDIMRSGQRSSLLERVITAMEWAGKAVCCAAGHESFTFYMIAMEGLLLCPSETDSKCGPLIRRAALLLSDAEEVRKKIKRRISHLYGIRSSIVHTGSGCVSAAELESLKLYCLSCIVRVLTHPRFWPLTDEEKFDETLRAMSA